MHCVYLLYVWTLVFEGTYTTTQVTEGLDKEISLVFVVHRAGTPNCALNKATGLSTCVHTLDTPM